MVFIQTLAKIVGGVFLALGIFACLLAGDLLGPNPGPGPMLSIIGVVCVALGCIPTKTPGQGK
jgi:hypothetical protein